MSSQPLPQPMKVPARCHEISVTKGGKIFVCNEFEHPEGEHYFTREG